MSRVARANRAWHHRLEVCALFGPLLGDLDGIYDPTDYNDRLLLGLKKPSTYSTDFTLASSTHRFLLVPASTLDNIADRSILKWLAMSTAEAFGIEHLGNLRLCMLRHQLLNTVLNRGWRPRRPRPDQGAIDGQCRMGTRVPLHIQMNFALLPDPIEMHAFD